MNKKIGLMIIAIIVLVIVFYGGMVYGKGQTGGRGQGMQVFGQNSLSGRNGMMGGKNSNGNVFGKIIAKDANSITVEMRAPGNPNDTTTTNTGSKIVFYTDKTAVSKTVDGTINDLAVGTQVSINGTSNTDGSVNAQSVQIRPNIPTSVVK
jgi:hypothetical protein